MILPEDGCLMRIFIGESSRFEGKPLFEWIVLRARQEGLAGATVMRGMLGFGPGSKLQTTKILRLSQDLPVVIEIIDTQEKLEPFLKIIDPVIQNGLVTLEKAYIKLYRSHEKA